MTDSGKPNLEDRSDDRIADRIDLYVRRELTAAEARELAQESLDSPELFEELTYSALAKTALSARTVPGKIVRFPRKAWLVVSATAAAAVVLISLYAVKPSFLRTPNPPQETAASSRPKPTLGLSANPGQPVLLASGLQPPQAGQDGTPVFRSPETDSRAPQPAGSIVSIEDGLAAINLGSLDGLAKGSELQVFRDDRSTQPIGRLRVTTVFRERARGRILTGGQIQVKDQVRVPGAAHLGALSEQMDAWNNLAVIHMLRGDYDGAEAPLSRAVSTSPKTGSAYGRSVNNLGVLAELRGDRRKAEALYADALRALAGIADSPEQERRAVETNLARIRGLR